MLQKTRKMIADSEFGEGRRSTFANEGNNLFFAGSDMLVRNHTVPAAQVR